MIIDTNLGNNSSGIHSALKKPLLAPISPNVHNAIDDLFPDDSYEDDIRLK